ncbi:MAG: DMT family transporter [Bacteroidales bacterium]|jgi:drug/metabolite transporter (DMT)-like permease|nr:DMT family transporter [Bacteroidales bacterium]
MSRLRTIRADGLLLITAIIWGFAFVAQRAGMDHVGPFTYNAVRFALGGLSLMPLLLLPINKRKKTALASDIIKFGVLAGIALFLGSSFQQIGLQYTTAGNAGFITGLYVIFVPIIALFWRNKTDWFTWTGAILAVAGMYFLSITKNLTINPGDLYVLVSSVFFAVHVLIISWLSPRFNTVRLSIIQFFATAVFSLIIALFKEEILLSSIIDAAIPILYGGIFSAGVAYTLQVFAQKDAPASHAAIILSLESVFAVLGGWLILNESLTDRSLLGCALMLSGMLFAQTGKYLFGKKNNR